MSGESRDCFREEKAKCAMARPGTSAARYRRCEISLRLGAGEAVDGCGEEGESERRLEAGQATMRWSAITWGAMSRHRP